MGNRIGKLFGSRSGSEDITPVPSKPKKDTKESAATTLQPSNVAATVPQTVGKTTPTLSSDTVKKDIVSSVVTESNNSATVNSVPVTTEVTNRSESHITETIETNPEPQNKFVLPEFLLVLMKQIAEKEGFTNYTLDVSAGSNNADGFLAVIKRVVLSGSRNGKPDQLPLICKLIPTSKARREQFNFDAVFIREAFVYSQVLPIFAEFQKEKGLNGKEGFCEYPKCYGTLDDKENDRFVIVLEDLKATGFQMFNKLNAADINHVKLFAEILGKFHAVSFALKDQRPEIFDKFKHMKDAFVQQLIDQPEALVQMFAFFFDRSIAAFKPEEQAEIKALNKMKENFAEELKATASGEASEPFSIINHGDCWNNNMMYLYGTESNVPVNICLLDYQICRYSSPALDLVYFLFSSTDKPIRDAYYTEIIQLYHKTLSTNLAKMGSDANKLFSFEDLQDQLKKFGRYALIIAPMLMHVLTTKAEDIPDLDYMAEEFKDKPIEEGMKAFLNDSGDDKFNARIRDVVQDILRLGYY